MKHGFLIIVCIILCGCAKGAKQESLSKLLLMPDQGKMHCNVVVKDHEAKQVFALTLPETIGSKEGMILNFPSTIIKWEGPDQDGIVTTSWTTDSVISYNLTLTPGHDFVDAKMTIKNLTESTWNDVWSFNCLNPTRALAFKDKLMTRTYMSVHSGPELLSNTTRVKGHKPTIGIYFNESVDDHESYPFVSDFAATSPDRTNGNYLVILNESKDAYMAATSPNALFLFNNLKYKCIHSAPNFGRIDPGQSNTVTSRFYFAKGDLDDFLKRYTSEVLH